VTAPNADTLYSTAWIDIGKEPYILHVPDEHGRFYLMPMLDGWTNVFADPGKRTTGTAAADFAITGPDWKGTLPPGIKAEYKSPTNIVWVLGRTYSTGTSDDYAAVNAIQAQYKLTPLSAWGKPYTPPPGVVNPAWDTKDPVRDQVDSMDGATYFRLLADLMKTNPPAAADAPMVTRMAKIGLVPGQDFDPAKLDPTASAAVQAAPRPAQAAIMGLLKEVALTNGWSGFTKLGVYGTEYRLRALVTAIGLGANRPQDAIYPVGEVDADGKPFDGANRYVIHFRRGHLHGKQWRTDHVEDESSGGRCCLAALRIGHDGADAAGRAGGTASLQTRHRAVLQPGPAGPRPDQGLHEGARPRALRPLQGSALSSMAATMRRLRELPA
jgi:hypothetical protein